ncbi:TPA: hypothetical protein OMH09_002446 [Enterococcus faecalis]|nr:hypothetical protein [Enterococcus faecalis]EIT5122289.1 hypothetical protein [Enterococcus faecalis]HCQ8726300.1 hypothetical protein [Enterococcus faecalis]
MGKKFDDALENFLVSNDVRDSKEEYVKNFRKKFGYFLSQKKLTDKISVSNFLIDGISNYRYYSRETVEHIFQKFHHDFLSQVVNMQKTIFCNISNVENLTKYNSSNFFLSKYLEVNSLDNSKGFDIYQELLAKPESKRIRKVETIVFIDDFSGSGNTIIAYFKKLLPFLKDKKIVIYCIHIMEDAEKNILRFVEENKGSNAIYLKYSCKSKKILNSSPELRKVIRDFEKNDLSSSFPLGYDESEALVTFYRNSPNNTISSYWNHFEGYWSALFPRKQAEFDFLSHQKDLKNIKYNLSILKIKNYEIKVVVTLVYLNEYKATSESFELRNILMYNKRQLRVHYDYLIQDGWINIERALSTKAMEYLKSNNLSSLSFKDLIKDPMDSFTKSKDALTLDDDYFSS